MTPLPTTIHLRNGGTSVFLRIHGDSLPEILHWGEDLGYLDASACEQFATAQVIPPTSGTPDVSPRLTMIPQQSEGWLGTPGLQGSQCGRRQFSAFVPTEVTTNADANAPTHTGPGTASAASPTHTDPNTGRAPTTATITAHDDEANLSLSIELRLEDSGLLRTRATLTNDAEGHYSVDSLLLALPTPASESLVIDQTGRHLRERDTVTHEFTIGSHERTSRIARGHAASSIHGTCTPGPLWTKGSAHYIHVAWSGNTRTVAERTPVGQQCLLAGELLMPGEVTLGTGESYSTPWIYATWGNGLNEAAGRIHDFLRSRPGHPTSPRPITLNAWEAVYFDHSLPRLLALVDQAARLGVERFVLDDGWFGSRRNDKSGLGDWVISPEVWPHGLNPLADAVHQRGMQFGLWFEPEMVNPDSDVARAHPEWMLSPATHRPQEARFQQVMDLTNPDAFEHVRSQMLAVLDSVQVDYIKWDFNRDLMEATSPRTGLPAYHAQTLATYALLDAIKAAHPEIEIESCAGGGGRIDLEIMQRCVRVWASDCIDPLERQLIEAGTLLLLPPEMVGSHVASTTSHTTGRTLALSLRAATAMMSHMGIEWDLTKVSAEDLHELGGWIDLHKELRPLLHSGRVLHADHPDKAWNIRGVVNHDRDEAVFVLVHLETSAQRPSPSVCLPGLDPEATYRVQHLHPTNPSFPVDGYIPTVPWWGEGTVLPGRVLETAGVRIPALNPAQALVLRVTRV